MGSGRTFQKWTAYFPMSDQTITQKYRVITPAYGRDYKSAKEVKQAFLDGKDFLLQPENLPCGISDFAKGVTVNIRFKRMANVTNLKV